MANSWSHSNTETTLLQGPLALFAPEAAFDHWRIACFSGKVRSAATKASFSSVF